MSALYIVTGAFGHLGNTVVRQLIEKGAAVRCLAYNEQQKSVLKDFPIECVVGDLCDPATLGSLFDDIESREVFVIHAAGIVSVATKTNPRIAQVNVEGTRRVVDMCLEKRVKRLLYVSSVHAIPEKSDSDCIGEVTSFEAEAVFGAYAKTKAQATQIVLNSVKQGLDAVIVHPSGIIGPYDYEIGHMTQLVVNYLNGTLHFGVDGGYDFVDVRDVAQGLLAALTQGKMGECYILSNRYVSVRELLGTLADLTQGRRINLFLPRWFLTPVAGILETYDHLAHRKPLFTHYTLYTLFSKSNFSHEKARKELGYTPRSLIDTLKDTLEFVDTQISHQRGSAHEI